MQGIHLRKYGVEATIDFEVYKVDGVDLRVDWIPAQADCEIMKDGGASTMCTNTATDKGSTFSIVLTATEMQFARGVIKVVDAVTKVFLDKVIIVETYGHANAQHAFDLDTATQDVNVASEDNIDFGAAKKSSLNAATTDLTAITGDKASYKATGFSTHNAAAVKTALEADGAKLDHLWEMTEDDAGTRRLTINALEQAPSGGLNEQQTRDAMKLAPTGNSPAAGSIDKHLDDIETEIASSITHLLDVKGTGFVKDTHSLPQCLTSAETDVTNATHTYTVLDGDGNGIPDVLVEAKINDILIQSARTNTSGIATFYLAPGTYDFYATKSGYSFSNPDQEVVSA